MTSRQMRENPLFMRNNYNTDGKWGLPVIKKQTIYTTDIELIACSDTKPHEPEGNKRLGVHFLLMTIVLTEYMIIPKKRLISIRNTDFYFLLIILHTQI